MKSITRIGWNLAFAAMLISASPAALSATPKGANTPPRIVEFNFGLAEPPPYEIPFAFLVQDDDGDTLNCTVDMTGAGDPAQIRQFPSCQGSVAFHHIYTTGSAFDPVLTVSDGQAEARALVRNGPVRINLPTRITIGNQHLALIGSQFDVVASVASTSEVTAIVARIAGQQMPMTFSDGAFRASFDLSAVSRGQHLLDVQMDTADGGHYFHYLWLVLDDPPTIAWDPELPRNDTVARTSVHAAAQCVDDVPGCSIQLSFFGTEIAQVDLGTATESFDAVVDLASGDGRCGRLEFTATDSVGHALVRVSRKVCVESSQRLVDVVETTGRIADTDGRRVLHVINDTGTGDRVFLLDLQTGNEIEIPVPVGKSARETPITAPTPPPEYEPRFKAARVTPIGALIAMRDSGGDDFELYEWNGAALLNHGSYHTNSGQLQVAGRYAAWRSGTAGLLRDVIAGTTTPAANYTSGAVLDASGRLTYRSDSRTIRQEPGAIVVSEPTLFVDRLSADSGPLVAYRRFTGTTPTQYETVLLTPGSEVILRPLATWPYDGGPDVSVRDGWAFYSRTGNLNQAHFWSYSPTGETRQRTLFGTNSTFPVYGYDGDLMISNQRRHWLSDGDGRIVDVASALGKTYPTEDGWLTSIMRNLYRITGTSQFFDDGFE